MKFLLVAVNAKYIHSNPAIHSLYAYAGKELQPFLAVAEYTINNRVEELLSDIYRRKPDVIGFSCYIWNISLIRELLLELPKVLPDMDIWLGGPEVSYDSEKLLAACPGLKGVMAGEGEETFKELLTFYVQKEKKAKNPQYDALEQIPGLVLPSGRTEERQLTDIDELPFFYQSLEEFQNKIIYYESSRGCPYRCSYCLSSIDKRVRLRNSKTVKKELEFFLERRVPQVKFIDRTFNCNHSHAMEIWRYIKENDNGVTNFHFEIAADILTPEEIEILSSMRPGLVQLEIGVQSVNERTLQEINRPANTGHIAETVAELKKNKNIHIHLDLIAGLPFEDYNSFIHSFNEVYAMGPEQLQLGFLKVLKGTPMQKKAAAYGLVYQSSPPYEVLYTKWLSYKELLRLKRVEEMVELYYNSNQYTHVLDLLEEAFEHPFAMFLALADYYEEKGYFINTPSRDYRYKALLAFACETDEERGGLYRELLTYDYYLRENAKSRPEYAGDLSGYKKQIYDFYCREKENPKYLPAYRGYEAKQMMRMTHMEVFYYPVWEKASKADFKRREQPAFLLFDYRKRNPLTGDAEVIRADIAGFPADTLS